MWHVFHGEEGSIVRGWFFVGCKSWERKRALCENGVFCWLQEWGEEKRALGGRGIFMARGTNSAIIEKSAPEKIRVVVGSILVKLIQF
jgi:hypothetical protein